MRVVVTRLDGAGDVLLAGPALRAVSRRADVTLLCSSAGLPAARLLPGITTKVFNGPWVHRDSPPVRARELVGLVWGLRGYHEAIILTSSFQSSLPMALLLRMAGIGAITAISDDYPGSLLDSRVRVKDDLHEVQRNLATVRAAGYPGDDRLILRDDLPEYPMPNGDYVVLHPGAGASSRAIGESLATSAVEHLSAAGLTVLVTGNLKEKSLTARVAGDKGMDLGGRTTFGQLAYLLRGSRAAIVGDTGLAHLAASVGTPVVSVAPVVPPRTWAPYGVPSVVLGDQDAPFVDPRVRDKPTPGLPCLTGLSGAEIASTVLDLVQGVRA
jgi:ADP-heptose:LPS heptosyltransferase